MTLSVNCNLLPLNLSLCSTKAITHILWLRVEILKQTLRVSQCVPERPLLKVLKVSVLVDLPTPVVA